MTTGSCQSLDPEGRDRNQAVIYNCAQFTDSFTYPCQNVLDAMSDPDMTQSSKRMGEACDANDQAILLCQDRHKDCEGATEAVADCALVFPGFQGTLPKAHTSP